jgi:hypothetical protein
MRILIVAAVVVALIWWLAPRCKSEAGLMVGGILMRGRRQICNQ